MFCCLRVSSASRESVVHGENGVEGAIPAELVRENVRGTAYGLMGTVNGVGDFVASALVWVRFGQSSVLVAGGAAVRVTDGTRLRFDVLQYSSRHCMTKSSTP